MSSYLIKSCIVLVLFLYNFAKAVEISNAITSTQIINSDNSILTVTSNGNLQVENASPSFGVNISNTVSNFTFSNNGTISTRNNVLNTYAIGTSGYYDLIDSTITNHGTISAVSSTADAEGIYIENDFSHSFLTNSATGVIEVVAGDIAMGIDIWSLHNGSSITNNGRISVASSSNDAYGILVWDELYDSMITNTGTVNVSAGDWGYGILSSYDLRRSQIVNAGTVNVTSTTSWADGIYVEEMNSASLLNSGTVNVNGYRWSNGISINWDMYDSNLTNSGFINVTSANSFADGIILWDINNSSIKNSGTIDVLGLDWSIGIEGWSLDSSSVLNEGNIYVTSTDWTAEGIYFAADMNNSTISNSGTIRVDAPIDSYGIDVDAMDTLSSINNSGTVTALVNNVMDKKGYSIYVGSGTGTITNETTGTLYGNLYVASSGSFLNNGTIHLPYNAYGADSAYVKTYSQSASGKLGIALNSSTEYSQLKTDNAILSDSTSIYVNVLEGGIINAGETLNDVISATSSLSVNSGALQVIDSSVLLNFEAFQSGNSLGLNAVQSQTPGDVVVAVNPTLAEVGQVLDVIVGGSYPDMFEFIGSLNALTSETNIALAVSSTTPMVQNATANAIVQIQNAVQQVINLRQQYTMTGMNSGDLLFTDRNVWINAFGSKGSQNDKDGIDGFDLKSKGIGFGMDAEYAENERIGFGIFAIDTDVDVNHAAQKSDISLIQSVLYGNIPVVDKNTHIRYQAGYARQKTESDRTILTTQQHAKADFASNTYSADLSLVSLYKYSPSMLLQPRLRTTYRYFDNPAYTESGAGGLNLNIEESTASQFIVSLGSSAEYEFAKGSSLLIDLEAGYDFQHGSNKVVSSFAGAPALFFTTRGIDNGGWNYNLTAGYGLSTKSGHQLKLLYGYEAQGESFANHLASVRYIYTF